MLNFYSNANDISAQPSQLRNENQQGNQQNFATHEKWLKILHDEYGMENVALKNGAGGIIDADSTSAIIRGLIPLTLINLSVTVERKEALCKDLFQYYKELNVDNEPNRDIKTAISRMLPPMRKENWDAYVDAKKTKHGASEYTPHYHLDEKYGVSTHNLNGEIKANTNEEEMFFAATSKGR